MFLVLFNGLHNLTCSLLGVQIATDCSRTRVRQGALSSDRMLSEDRVGVREKSGRYAVFQRTGAARCNEPNTGGGGGGQNSYTGSFSSLDVVIGGKGGGGYGAFTLTSVKDAILMKSFDQVGDNGGGVSIEFVCSYRGLSTRLGTIQKWGRGSKLPHFIYSLPNYYKTCIVIVFSHFFIWLPSVHFLLCLTCYSY